MNGPHYPLSGLVERQALQVVGRFGPVLVAAARPVRRVLAVRPRAVHRHAVHHARHAAMHHAGVRVHHASVHLLNSIR